MTLWIGRSSFDYPCRVFLSHPFWTPVEVRRHVRAIRPEPDASAGRWDGYDRLGELTVEAVEELTGIVIAPRQLISVEINSKFLTCEEAPQ